MIEGPSGSGKTSLALGLLEAARYRKVKSSFICDDQALLSTKNKLLWAAAPSSIAGKVELHGYGIADIEFVARCKIALVCELVEQEEIIRLPAACKCERMGVVLDHITTPARHEAQGIRIVLQKLSLPLLSCCVS